MIVKTFGEHGPEIVVLPNGQTMNVAGRTSVVFEGTDSGPEPRSLSDQEIERIAQRAAEIAVDAMTLAFQREGEGRV